MILKSDEYHTLMEFLVTLAELKIATRYGDFMKYTNVEYDHWLSFWTLTRSNND